MKLDLSKIGATIEGDAEKVVAFLAKTEVKISQEAPKAVAGLQLLIPAVDKALGDVAQAAGSPASLVIALPGDIADFKAIWPAVKSYVQKLES
jgi:hypothetical protein